MSFFAWQNDYIRVFISGGLLSDCFLLFRLQIHGSSIPYHGDLQESLEQVLQVHQTQWSRISDMSHYTSCLLDYCKQRDF